MSHSYESNTFAVCPQMVPRPFLSLDELDRFVESLTEGKYSEQRDIHHAHDLHDRCLVLYGSSRSGWFQQAIENCERGQKRTGLAFLSGQQYDVKFDVEEDGECVGYSTVTVLDRQKIDLAIAEIQFLFEWGKSSPLLIIEEFPGYETMPDWSPAEKARIGRIQH